MVRRLPVLETTGAIRTDGSRRVIHPAEVRGRFHTARSAVFYALVVLLLALPWIRVGGRPAVLLDIAARQFFLFGATFNAQDTSLLFFVLIGLGWLLVFVTTLVGRVWCGWTCPQTVFLEGLFRPIERLLLGSSNERMARDAAALTVNGALRKIAVHALWLLGAALIAHAVLSLFVAPAQLASMIKRGPQASMATFLFALVTTATVYFNFAWFREQTCLIVCPYGRLQSSLVDEHSLTVGYDRARGEPRAKAVHHDPESVAQKSGDCVDCKRCVVVCPTGIDIRNGPQYDCIGCTACIDACDEIMDKLKRPRGLVRYDSLKGFDRQSTQWLRPRVIFYGFVGVIIVAAAAVALRQHAAFVANVLRVQGAPYTLVGDEVRNAFELHVVSKKSERMVLRIEAVAQPGVTFVLPLTRVVLQPFADVRVPVFVSALRSGTAGDFAAHLRVTREGAPENELQVVSLPCIAPPAQLEGTR
jgi:cytochrome c oxidase accessory protein FixG